MYAFALKTGRSFFIRTQDDVRILIDGGGNSEIIRHITRILPFYSRRIDAVIATNTDSKNVSGLVDILDRYDVGQAYVPAITLESLHLSSSTDFAYQALSKVIADKAIENHHIKAGDRLVINDHNIELLKEFTGSENNGIVIDILFPVSIDSFSYSKASAPEVLFTVRKGETRVVFLGGATTKIQKHIVLTKENLIKKADVLIVSSSATSGNLALDTMNTVDPKYLIYSKSPRSISTGLPQKNKSPDPLASILNDQRFNLKDGGSVKIIFDSKKVSMENF